MIKHSLSFIVIFLCGCAHLSPYDKGDFNNSPKLRHSGIPLQSGTKFFVRQGAFGKSSHNEKGIEFFWDLEVPWNTPIVAVEDGKVLYLYQPKNAGGGCDPKFSNDAWNILVENKDGTVAQYTHVQALVKENAIVHKGQVIGKNVPRGWVCYPHVHYGIYRSKETLYNSPHRENLPLYFDGIEGGLLKEGHEYVAP